MICSSVICLVTCKVYNYADDNTLSIVANDMCLVKSSLEHDAANVIEWFKMNFMEANPNKFQLLFLGRNIQSSDHSINISNNILTGTDCINILGVDFDQNLNFSCHIKNICSKTAKQINALSRINSHLDRISRKSLYNCYIV